VTARASIPRGYGGKAHACVPTPCRKSGVEHGAQGAVGGVRIARTTASRRAPASTTEAGFAASIPPIANHGTVALSTAIATSSSPTAGRPGFVGVANKQA
jgi:hypothetical protein